jgi:iron complex transport system substrate-binding protein
LFFFNIASSYAFTVKDSLGRSVTLDKEPLRIACLAPSITEILYFLGLGDRVVGVTQFSYFPAEASKQPKVGSYNNLNVEKIVSLSPDLAIGTADGNEPYIVQMLSEAGIHVYIVNPRKIRDVIKSIAQLGELCGIGKKARALSRGLLERVENVYSKTINLERPLVFLQINIRPMMTVNKNTFHHDVIRLAGGKNMTEDETITYPRISIEEVIRRGPDVIVLSSMERGGRFERARKEWMKWSMIPAVKSGRVHLIDSDLLDRPSPRIVSGLEQMAKIVHPEIIWDR